MFNLTKNQRDHTCRKRTCLSPSFTHVMCHIKSWNCSEKIKFLVVPNGITLAEMHSVRFTGTAGAAGLHKKTKNGKADCFALLRWITKLKCVNSEVKSVLSHPKKGCLNWLHGTLSEPPWTLHSTRMDLWIDPSGTESCKHAIRLVTYNIYMGLWWPPAATYMRPGASPQSRRYVFTGPGEVSSLVTDPPGTPVTPCIIISIVIIRKGEERRKKKREVLHLFRCYTHTRTPTLNYKKHVI